MHRMQRRKPSDGGKNTPIRGAYKGRRRWVLDPARFEPKERTTGFGGGAGATGAGAALVWGGDMVKKGEGARGAVARSTPDVERPAIHLSWMGLLSAMTGVGGAWRDGDVAIRETERAVRCEREWV